MALDLAQVATVAATACVSCHTQIEGEILRCALRQGHGRIFAKTGVKLQIAWEFVWKQTATFCISTLAAPANLFLVCIDLGWRQFHK